MRVPMLKERHVRSGQIPRASPYTSPAHTSHVSELTCGIDEAGVGSIIGPVIFAGVAMHPEAVDAARALGIRDSKSMVCEDVSSLYKQITVSTHILHHAVAIPPREIDKAASFDRNDKRRSRRRRRWHHHKQQPRTPHPNTHGKTRMQRVRCAAQIIARLSSICSTRGHTIRTAYVDAFGPDAEGLARDIMRAAREMISPHAGHEIPYVTVQSRADRTMPQVSAASIIAGAVHRLEVQKIRDAMASMGYVTRGPDAFGPADNAQMYRFIYDYYVRRGRLPDFVRAESRPMRRLARHKVTNPAAPEVRHTP